MLINELLVEDLQNEGIKQNIAAMVFGALTALGGSAASAKAPVTDQNPQTATAVSKSAAVAAPAPVSTANSVVMPDTQTAIKIIRDIGRKSKLQGEALDAFTRLLITGLRAKLSGAELVAFISQCAHESAEFTRMHEIGSERYFDKKYGPEHKDLENNKSVILGNTINGDGHKFHGRGFIQITGRENYTKAGKALGLDLVNDPDIAADPRYSARVSLWFWIERVHGRVKDFSDVKDVTRQINPKLHGFEQRKKLYRKYAAIGLPEADAQA